MKRYLLFKGEIYYPQGGWKDFVGDYDNLKEAETYLKKLGAYSWDWAEVLDTEEMVVKEFDADDFRPERTYLKTTYPILFSAADIPMDWNKEK